ncbi:MAG: polysaccharide pyruvyl transferase family protein [Trichormus sp. ATA11-4-KO1]|jgi:polysaccharide pyruvyl transferase WcaK-like protein|nr:polysaccharide pyruvyl transferase family protein [Trichormus sp. ATA11-4-KO1]
MKIGIITFHHIDNYGATLQAYALWNFLNSQGYDVEIIDYRPYRAVRYYTKSLRPIRRKKLSIHESQKLSIHQLHINEKIFVNISRAWKIRQFLLSHVRLSQRKFYRKKGLQHFNSKYDVVICGSDQIWSLNSIRGFDASFFLDFVNNQATRKISYAASFGELTVLNNHREEICNLVNQFQTILVRDSNSERIIVNQCNMVAKKVLDPTFLINYDAIKHIPKIEGKYLLIYNQDELASTEEDLVKSIAERHGLNIVSIGKCNQVAKVNLENACPQEWIGAFSQASYIVTNTYHGTIFAIIFQKPFSVFVPSNKSNKVTDLLRDLSLEDRIFSENTISQVKEKAFDIDYEIVSKVLELKILESKKYLLEAITEGADRNKNKVECSKE